MSNTITHHKSNVAEPYFEVWLMFEDENDEEATYEANTRETDYGFAIDWYHTAVGQVVTAEFDTLEEAHAWYERNGYGDYTVHECDVDCKGC